MENMDSPLRTYKESLFLFLYHLTLKHLEFFVVVTFFSYPFILCIYIVHVVK